MLVKFSVTNYRSIRNTLTLSAVAHKGGELRDTNVFAIPGAPEQFLLPALAIYGANASGKSNILRALYLMAQIVRYSSGHTEGAEMPLRPFLLSRETSAEPTRFEVEFWQDVPELGRKVRFLYAFTATKSRISKETLFSWPNGRRRCLIDRSLAEDGKTLWKETPGLRGPKKQWQEMTSDNALFLSRAVQFNSDDLRPVHAWFSKTLGMWHAHADEEWMGFTRQRSGFTLKKFLESQSFKEQLLELLHSADHCIREIQVEKETIPWGKVPAVLRPTDSSAKPLLYYRANYSAKTVHRTHEGDDVALSLFDDESQGTQAFLSLCGPVLETLNTGGVLLVDELNTGLHPLLSSHLVGLFNSPETNPNCAQIIFATHEVDLLQRKNLRADQFWICDKNRREETTIRSLHDLSARMDRDNVRLRYLAGEYGGIPAPYQPILYAGNDGASEEGAPDEQQAEHPDCDGGGD